MEPALVTIAAVAGVASRFSTPDVTAPSIGTPAPNLALDQLDHWLAHASPGDRVAYHRGYLAFDRGRGSRLGEEAGQELDRIAGAVMAMAGAGQVHLVQHRHGAYDYSYLVVAARVRAAS